MLTITEKRWCASHAAISSVIRVALVVMLKETERSKRNASRSAW